MASIITGMVLLIYRLRNNPVLLADYLNTKFN